MPAVFELKPGSPLHDIGEVHILLPLLFISSGSIYPPIGYLVPIDGDTIIMMANLLIGTIPIAVGHLYCIGEEQ